MFHLYGSSFVTFNDEQVVDVRHHPGVLIVILAKKYCRVGAQLIQSASFQRSTELLVEYLGGLIQAV